MTAGELAGLGEIAYRRIRSMILYQELRPGERTSVAQLAEATNLGRAPVKSAVERLAAEGLLHVRDRSGTYVAQLKPEDVNHLFELRQIYEEAAAPLIVERVTPEQVTEISGLLAQLEATQSTRSGGDRSGFVAFIDADVEFHRRVIAGANNPFLDSHFSRLNLHLLIAHYLILDIGRHASDRHAEHVAIAQAVESRDAEALREAMVKHTLSVRDTILSTMEELESLTRS